MAVRSAWVRVWIGSVDKSVGSKYEKGLNNNKLGGIHRKLVVNKQVSIRALSEAHKRASVFLSGIVLSKGVGSNYSMFGKN